MKRRTFIGALMLFATLFFSGCATVPHPITQEVLQSTRSVAVVSVLDPTVRYAKYGLTIFNNEMFAMNLPDFKQNEIFKEAATAAFSEKNPDIKLIGVEFSDDEVSKLYSSDGKLKSGDGREFVKDVISAKLGGVAPDLIVLARSTTGQIIYNAPMGYGSGLYVRALPLVDPMVVPHVIANVNVFDGRSLEVVASRYIGPSPWSGPATIWRDKSFVLESKDKELTNSQQETITKALTTMLSQGTSSAIATLFDVTKSGAK